MAIDLSRLSRDEKLRLYDFIQEKKRRIREAGDVYAPNDGQKPVHASKAFVRAVFSGNGAGKTALGANEALWWLNGYNPILDELSRVPARIIVVLDHPEKVTDAWVPEISKWATLRPDQLHKRGKPYVSQITWDTGSELLFMFHDQSPLIFESIEADYIIFDEPPPRHVYVALLRGLRKKGSKPRILFLGTPITGSWMRKEILEPWQQGNAPDTECFVFGTAVNEGNLADGYIQSFGAKLTEKERRIRLFGEFFDLEGLALAEYWDEAVHVIERFDWPQAWPCVVAIDPHKQKPHHAVLLGVDNDGYLYYIKEIKAKKVATEFADDLKAFYKGFNVIDITCDSMGNEPYTGGEGFKSFIQQLRDHGVPVRATSWEDKNDEDFIERIQSSLVIPKEPNNMGRFIPRLRIFRGNPGIAGDIQNVQWLKIRNQDEYKPKLDITNKDFLSCLKYALATNLTPHKSKARVYRPSHAAETYGIKDKSSRGRWQRIIKKHR